MFFSSNKKNNVYSGNPQFYYIKVGFKGVKIMYLCFRDDGRVFKIMKKVKVVSLTYNTPPLHPYKIYESNPLKNEGNI